jgi:copper chaperone
MKMLTLKIDGMNCDGCASRITSLLEKEAGVREVDVSYSSGEGQISYNSHALEQARIFEVIELAGFGAKRV